MIRPSSCVILCSLLAVYRGLGSSRRYSISWLIVFKSCTSPLGLVFCSLLFFPHHPQSSSCNKETCRGRAGAGALWAQVRMHCGLAFPWCTPMAAAELAAAESRGGSPLEPLVTVNNGTPIGQRANDPGYSKKWRYGMEFKTITVK